MNEKPENPSAYPCVGFSALGDSHLQFGMSLRDYFAAAALPRILDRYNISGWNYAKDLVAGQAATHAYIMADAMLAARGQS